MAWDRTTIETEVQNEIQDWEADTLTNLRQFIDDICRIIWFKHDWSFREATGYLDTDGINQGLTVSAQLTSVAQILEIGFKGASETAYRPLGFVPYKQFLRQYKTAAASVANPTAWTYYAGQIIFDTIPPALTDSVEVTYDKEFVNLTTGASVPLIPEKYKHVIKSGVKWFYYESDDDDRATTEKIKFQGQAFEKGTGGLIGEMLGEDAENVEGPHQNTAMGFRGIMFGKR